jgi:hypothetical protein
MLFKIVPEAGMNLVKLGKVRLGGLAWPGGGGGRWPRRRREEIGR